MSFSSEVKEELEKVVPDSRHCQLAELSAIIHFGCRIEQEESGQKKIALLSENSFVTRKYFTLLKKTFIINGNVGTDKILQAVKILDEGGNMHLLSEQISPLLIRNSCCRRAFLRGAFLCAGSMSDPRKGYHLEFVCENEAQAQQIRQAGAGIVDLLNVMGAHRSLMLLENLRVEKEVRNSVNRQVNCEAANITKMVRAASKQIEDIRLLQKHYGMSNLPDNLRQMAQIRLEHPDSSLQELGKYLDPPVGKSGVNHRLRKLSEIAERIKG